ncbi:alpha/beta hydrolase [Pantoea sp. 18069]|uniref:alpha/beta hydrolase n=1 Tax=Pantoea sp. 18069 TaxID=2681415 RepID=UPI00135854EB|nr:alpha/beta hydrolase [Pantoea sp. 18069]
MREFPRLDAQLAAVVAALRARGAPPPFSGSAPQARARMRDAVLAARARFGLPEVRSAEDAVAVHANVHVPVRVYRPHAHRHPLPTVVFFHGGGFVLGSVELMDDIARKLCRDTEAVVVSVDYRLAPEHPFPAAHDDALAATLWALANAAALGGDAARVAVAGESAGGNLAASSAIRARDLGLALAAQLLIVPGVDFARDTAALERSGRDYSLLTPHDLREVARLYLGASAHSAAQFPPSPLRHTDLSGLPPALVAVAGCDALCGEGLAYAQRLQAAGVCTRVLRYDDMFHPFFGFFELSQAARSANDEICDCFAAMLRNGPGNARGAST